MTFSLDKAIESRLDALPEQDHCSDGAESSNLTDAKPRFFKIRGNDSAAAVRVSIRSHPSTDTQLRDDNDLSATCTHVVTTQLGKVKCSGNALLGQCPQCNAPMTIRLWLRLADCWRCPASVALNEVTVREIEKAIPGTKTQRKPLPKPPPTPAQFFTRSPLDTIAPAINTNRAPRDDDYAAHSELEQLTEGSRLARLLRRTFRITPAWLVSFLLHLIAILILAMIFLSSQSNTQLETITLTTFLDPSDTTGGDIRPENPLDTLQDDVAMAVKMDLDRSNTRKVIARAVRDARELRVDPDNSARLPDLESVRKNVTQKAGYRMSFAARDPRIRAEIVTKEGGTNLTEASVARGLRWLASVQNDDGSWSLKDYDRSDRAGNRGDTMGTALALLPFLGAGQTHEFGIYKSTVASGLKWLIEQQSLDGDLRGSAKSNAGMYAHGQATIVLCEALAISGDRQFFDPAQRAIKFIEQAQHRSGGWRYRPGQAGDTSVFGWQMMAIQSAKATGMNIEMDKQTAVRADLFLDTVATKNRELPRGSLYSYQPRREVSEVMTAEALLCRMYLGWRKDDPRLKSGIKWLIENHLPSSRKKNVYYWYYGTQVMHHFGGKSWETWNQRIRTVLVESQSTRGRYPGSWSPDKFKWGRQGGRIYTTSMAVCTLEVYYRHLPLFKQLELE